ncbi:hypothetical protein [Serratia fonticola]|jgi:hypothetical protein|uniref:Uncharacterized protein n=1 Tax=Serratia fonticola TaxID=47917 RepID=A0A3S4XK01_SERFO|nr:hypothetical protein [Serratia fonticola]CAI0878677.1 Uncharacterised protein [Serratia fonticola]CAI1595280.1 Uncharacterised protein [Serratia fonticola]CAI1632836.1 Uncharacterised protein [Serratia fonticola]CAI1651973.1 Uncharacterised protein [Serratia fonticola]VEI74998.1 Uncharacterised protein [Serratia fonticola]
MKKIIGAALLLTVLLMCLWYFNAHHQGRNPFRCDTRQLSVQVKAKTNIVLNASSTILFSSSKSGMFYITGSVKENDTRYLLDRNISFAITPSEIKGGNNVQFTHEQIHPADNTPDNIWHNYLMPEIELVDIYTEAVPLFHNALLIRGFSNPFLVCIKQD